MFVLGVAKRSSGDFKPKDKDDVIPYDNVKVHVRLEFGVDSDVPEMSAGDAVDIIKVKTGIWKRFLDENGVTDNDLLGTSISMLYNKYGKISGISLK